MIPAKIAALIPRLGTSFEGEVIATRDAISRLLQAAGLDWHDLAAACTVPAVAPIPASHVPRHAHASFGDLARAARDLDRGQLTAKERSFVADMVQRGFAFHPSPKQAAWVDDILDRLRGRAAA